MSNNANHQPQMLLFVLDTTGSMGSWVQALVKILPEVVDTATLTGAFDAVGILEYGDYDLPEKYPVHFSGWGTVTPDAKSLFKPTPSSKPSKDMPDWHKNPDHTMEEVVTFAKTRKVRGGGGCPEAVKTAMYATVNICRETLYGFDEEDGSEAIGRCPFVHMVQLTDAPMHNAKSLDNEGKKESSLLGAANLDGPIVFNRLLVGLRHQLRYNCLCSAGDIVSYSHLAAITGGFSIVPPSVSVDALRKELQGLIAGWMGALPKDKESVASGPNLKLRLSKFESELRALAADASKQLAQLKHLPVTVASDGAPAAPAGGLLSKLVGAGGTVDQHPFVTKIDTANRVHIFHPATVGTEDQLHNAGNGNEVRTGEKGPLPSVASLASKLKQSVRRMKTDAAFVDEMAPTLKRICGESPMALCGNDVMGAMWRAFCTRREDPRRDEYLQLLDKAKNALSPAEKTAFEAWNKRSYNVSSEIRKYVQDFAAKNGVVGVVRFEGDSEGFVPQSVNEAFLSLKREGLQAVSEVLSRLQVDREFRMSASDAAAIGKPREAEGGSEEDEADDDDEEPTALAANELPLNMPVEDLFRHLLHIAIPGSRLSRRPAALLAVCAVRTGCVVKGEASAYLDEIKGKWIDWRRRKDLGQKGVLTDEDGNTPVVQENFNGAFMRLVRSVEGVLTAEERETTHYMQRISAVLGYERQEVEMEVLDPKSADGCFPDHVAQCGCCLQLRPLSLLKDDGRVGIQCGYCLRARTEAGRNLNKRDDVTNSSQPINAPPSSKSESQMQARCVGCGGFYARDKGLTRIDESKCHYCQFGLAPSTVECATCKLLIVSPGGRALPGGVCGPCAGGVPPRKVTTDTKPLAMRILFPRAQAEPSIVAAAGLVRAEGSDAAAVIPAGTSLPDAALLFDQAASLTEAAVNALSEIPPNPYTTATPQLQRDAAVQATHMRHMLNENALWERVVKSVRLTGRVGELPTCMMCCGDFQPDKMSRTCGRKGCEQRMCMTCLGEWYGKSVPGKAVVPRSLLCPCCGRTPAPSVLRKGNRDALQVRLYEQCHEYGVGGERVEDAFNSGMKPGEAMTKLHFGWCARCMKVHEYARKECNDFDPAMITEYTCPPCLRMEVAAMESSSSEEEEDEYMTAAQWREEVVRARLGRNETGARRALLERIRAERIASGRTVRHHVSKRFHSKACPGCKAPTIRVGGCAHVTCPNCRCHWCYICVKGFGSVTETYQHMSQDREHIKKEAKYDDEDDYGTYGRDVVEIEAYDSDDDYY